MRRKKLDKLSMTLGYISIFLGSIGILGIPFTHPEMTATQLIIEFWYLYLIFAGVIILGGLLINE